MGCLSDAAVGGGFRSTEPANTGTVEVFTTTTGSDLPPSYCALVYWASDSLNVHEQQDVGINASVAFAHVEEGAVRVELGGPCIGIDKRAGWPHNCVAQPGEMSGLGARQSVQVTEGSKVPVSFTVTCTAIP